MAQRETVDTDALARKYGMKVLPALPVGMLEPGNIDLVAQPRVKNPDGTVSTVDALSVWMNNMEILLPRVTPDGRHLRTAAQAVEEFRRTGLHLGKFRTPAHATAYAKQLQRDYDAGKYDPGYTTVVDPQVGTRLPFKTPEDAEAFRRDMRIGQPDVGPRPQVRGPVPGSNVTSWTMGAEPPITIRHPTLGEVTFTNEADAQAFRTKHGLVESATEKLARKYGLKVEMLTPIPPPDPGLIKLTPEPPIQGRDLPLPGLTIQGLEPGRR